MGTSGLRPEVEHQFDTEAVCCRSSRAPSVGGGAGVSPLMMWSRPSAWSTTTLVPRSVLLLADLGPAGDGDVFHQLPHHDGVGVLAGAVGWMSPNGHQRCEIVHS